MQASYGERSGNATSSNEGGADAPVERSDDHREVPFLEGCITQELDKRGKPLKEPTVLGEARSKYNTSFYEQYDPTKHSQSVKELAVGKYNGSYKVFNHYLLYSDPTTTAEEIHDRIPKRGVRLDDMTVALVLETIASPGKLHKWWPAEFDHLGMPRATRVPLGYAAKMWVSAGQRDVEGKVATKEDEGYYYLWWKGLQVLMGKEGHDAQLYKIRPSWEKDKCPGFGFKLTHKAVVPCLWMA